MKIKLKKKSSGSLLSKRQCSIHNWSPMYILQMIFKLQPNLSTTSIAFLESALVEWLELTSWKPKIFPAHTTLIYIFNIMVICNFWAIISFVCHYCNEISWFILLNTSSFTESINSFCIELKRQMKTVISSVVELIMNRCWK